MSAADLHEAAHSHGHSRQGGNLSAQVQDLSEGVNEGQRGKAGIGDPLGPLPLIHPIRL